MTEEDASRRLRLFFALWPERALQHALHRLGRQQQSVCGGRAMRGDGLHMTLLFLGSVDGGRLPALCRAVAAVRAPAFDFALQRLATWEHNRIGFAAPADTVPALDALVEALRQSVAAAGFDFDRRPFASHVTLLRGVERPAPSRDFPPLQWRARHFVLAASEATPVGSRYRVIQAWPLVTQRAAG